MENLVPEESYRKSRQAYSKLLVVLVIACIVAIVMSSLFVWQIGRPSKYLERDPKDSLSESGLCPEIPPLLPPLPSPLPHQLQEILDKFDGYVKSLVNADGLPAISANIYYRDSVIWTGHYGRKKLGGNKPDDKTRYRIGSISKVFPVLMMYKLFEQGKISSIDDPLNKYAKNFVINNPFTAESITLRQIANQLSGLPREAPCVTCTANETTQQQLVYLRNQSLVVEPGTIPSYSNLGYALLGRLLTERMNTTFEAWTKENILSPLGLKHTGFTINKDVKENMAFPYDNQGNVIPFMNIGWLSPAGQMYSTIEELAHFGMFLFGARKNQTILKMRSLREILAPSNVAPDGQTIWGSPWEMFLREHFLIRSKGGFIDGCTAMMTVIPEIKLGFNVILSSTANFTGFIANTIVDRVYKDLLPVFNNTLFQEIEKREFPEYQREFQML
ncbi:hypothetical protein QZH41_005067 [Actinostola sp. cb2023]|nr:hypothetical protein QZH41_005067 [Actinostola sp. cb2023]